MWLVGGLLWSLNALPAPTNETAVVDGGGAWSSNAAFRAFSAINQPTPPGKSANGAFINDAGFLATFLLTPQQDADGDGLADENDRDDDGDGISDADELAGSGFEPATPTDPLVADSDGDGASDAGEAAAGSNPLDAGSVLRILDVTRAAGTVRITWQARDGKTYELLGATELGALSNTPAILDTVSAAGGTPPWYGTTAVATNATSGRKLYYRVRLKEQFSDF